MCGYSAARIHRAGAGFGGVVPDFLLPAKGHGTGPGVRLPVSVALRHSARGSAFVPVAGLALVALGFVAGFFLGVPHTVRERVSMWLSPWNNLIHGGDELAESLWAFATGGTPAWVSGWATPQVVPAGHTDLILSVLGEEWGFLGVAVVFVLYAFLVYRALRIALRARGGYDFFLAAGLAAATALQFLLISAARSACCRSRAWSLRS